MLRDCTQTNVTYRFCFVCSFAFPSLVSLLLCVFASPFVCLFRPSPFFLSVLAEYLCSGSSSNSMPILNFSITYCRFSTTGSGDPWLTAPGTSSRLSICIISAGYVRLDSALSFCLCFCFPFALLLFACFFSPASLLSAPLPFCFSFCLSFLVSSI